MRADLDFADLVELTAGIAQADGRARHLPREAMSCSGTAVPG